MARITPPIWVCEDSIPTPQTKDGCAPAITATYEYASFANMVDTAHYPRLGIIELGHYDFPVGNPTIEIEE